MNIVFWGTPKFSVFSLQEILKSRHTVCAVVTIPDKQKGRGMQIQKSDVKIFAEENDIRVLQPENFSEERFIDSLKSIAADVFVVVAFKILPPEIFEIPKQGTFNLHGSLLPKYRGAAPIQWALINGDSETGVTTFKIQKKADTGNIYFQEKVFIHEDDNFQSLHDKLAVIGAKLVVKTLDAIESESVILQAQNDAEATLAPKITKEICEMDFNSSALALKNLVRGLSPFPSAFFMHNDKKLKIFRAAIAESHRFKPGEIKTIDGKIFIGTATSALEILELQLEGRKKLAAEEFLRGYSFS